MDEIFKYIQEFINVLISYIIPLASFIFSSVALYRANKSRETENRIQELELFIKEYKAEEIKQKQNTPLEAKIEARVIKVSDRKYRMKIWNSGNIRAYNIKASIPEKYKVFLMNNKCPYEYLEPGDSFEEHVIIYLGSQLKFEIITEWQDKDGNNYFNNQLRSI